jgi:hypothetical protein
MELVGGEWLKQIEPEVVELVVQRGRQVEREFGGLRCRLSRLCPSHSAAVLAVEAAASGMRPADVLRHCIVCRTDAKTVFRLIKCVEVRGDGYLFIASTRGGMELWLLYRNIEEAFKSLNEILAEHHNVAIDDSHFEEFVKLVYERAARCDFSITYDG